MGTACLQQHPGLITMSIGAPIETKGLKADEINQRVEAWIENEIQNLAH
jgi:1-acyl-sn-glycerol-3-phosphate acyltransferase